MNSQPPLSVQAFSEEGSHCSGSLFPARWMNCATGEHWDRPNQNSCSSPLSGPPSMLVSLKKFPTIWMKITPITTRLMVCSAKIFPSRLAATAFSLLDASRSFLVVVSTSLMEESSLALGCGSSSSRAVFFSLAHIFARFTTRSRRTSRTILKSWAKVDPLPLKVSSPLVNSEYSGDISQSISGTIEIRATTSIQKKKLHLYASRHTEFKINSAA
mmetsp:Transcript_53656/g.142692  ORF Transcript_53656/g.142692 Transcript_53656/m.142692 type:complete len:215 (-) Transcript_53656:298-942(-)